MLVVALAGDTKITTCNALAELQAVGCDCARSQCSGPWRISRASGAAKSIAQGCDPPEPQAAPLGTVVPMVNRYIPMVLYGDLMGFNGIYPLVI